MIAATRKFIGPIPKTVGSHTLPVNDADPTEREPYKVDLVLMMII